jgi:hypothetical protein
MLGREAYVGGNFILSHELKISLGDGTGTMIIPDDRPKKIAGTFVIIRQVGSTLT